SFRMALVTIPWHPSRKDLRIFAVLQLVFFTIIAFFVGRRIHAYGFPAAIMMVSAAVAAVGLLRPAWIRPVYIGWMLAVFPIGWVVSHVVLAIAYFGVVTPIGWLLRWRGYDPLDRRFDATASSYWKPRPPSPDVQRYFRQF
ncbi:MAG TPA: SxtJ family membrane protein, partial [Planctomycetaceae bacterium]|nr:SxtJ family membrane protein [Planctomycetaceae bacterium]